MDVAKEMQLTAGLSSRVEKPVLHVSISWQEYDNPTKDQMVEVADQYLQPMGLDKHQAMIISHQDKTHPHIHIMVNRVHPEKCKTWESFTYKSEDRDRKIDKGEYENYPVIAGDDSVEWSLRIATHTMAVWSIEMAIDAILHTLNSLPSGKNKDFILQKYSAKIKTIGQYLNRGRTT